MTDYYVDSKARPGGKGTGWDDAAGGEYKPAAITYLESNDPEVRRAQAKLQAFQKKEFRERCKARYLKLSDYEFAEELFDDLFGKDA